MFLKQYAIISDDEDDFIPRASTVPEDLSADITNDNKAADVSGSVEAKGAKGCGGEEGDNDVDDDDDDGPPEEQKIIHEDLTNLFDPDKAEPKKDDDAGGVASTESQVETRRRRKRKHKTDQAAEKPDDQAATAAVKKQRLPPAGDVLQRQIRPPTLLERLLLDEIRRERNLILQCVRYVCNNKFFINDQKSSAKTDASRENLSKADPTIVTPSEQVSTETLPEHITTSENSDIIDASKNGQSAPKDASIQNSL